MFQAVLIDLSVDTVRVSNATNKTRVYCHLTYQVDAINELELTACCRCTFTVPV